MNMRFNSYKKELNDWLSKGKYIIFSVSLVVILIIFIIYRCFVGFPEISLFVWGGCFLQLLGAILTISCMNNVLSYFGKDNLLKCLLGWLKEFPKWGKLEISDEYTGAVMPMSIIAGEGGPTWLEDNPDLPPEDQIKILQKNLQTLKAILNGQWHSLIEIHQELNDHKEDVNKNRIEMEKRIQTDLEILHIGDLFPVITGLLLITVGSIISTLAP